MKRIISSFTALITACALTFPVYSETGEPESEKPTVSAQSAILIDAENGTVLFEKAAYTERPMASTTKIMTTLLLLEDAEQKGDFDTEFTVDSEAIAVEGSSMGLVDGDIVTKRALCYGMMLPSGNDAANETAFILGGGVDGFSEMMNDKAFRLGMFKTHFVTPSGLHDDDHYSTAYDMAVLTAYALKNPAFAEICSSESIKIKYGNPPYDRWLSNTNKLLTLYDGCIGVKTGFTDEAGRCLITAAERDGVKLVAVTLNAPDDWNDHTKMLDYGFSAETNTEVKFDLFGKSADVVGGTDDSVPIKLQRNPVVSVKIGETPRIACKIYMDKFLYAPVTQGKVIGRAEFISNGNVVDAVDILTDGYVEQVTKKQIKPLYYVILDYFKSLV
ncbi:MAG: D-alanyl-D-alanine carboxypeptidase [Ruminococcus sp.]|nr:D-alanyl-D-alanine carboxypeptidase [Ruminococcus sp.]